MYKKTEHNSPKILKAILSIGQTFDVNIEYSNFIETLELIGYTNMSVHMKDGELYKCIEVKTLKNYEVFRRDFNNDILQGEVNGFIEIYKECEFSKIETQYLDVLINCFQRAIAACLCYRKLRKEIELRDIAERRLKEARDDIKRLVSENQDANEEFELKIKKYTKEFGETINRLEELACKDQMTGLYNRYQILELGEKVFENAVLHDKDFAVMMIDIDNFKLINDTYGHLIGDQVLKTFGKRLRSSVGKEDLVGRYGGEEFVVMLFCSKPNAEEVGERLRSVIADNDFSLENNVKLQVTISVGIASRRYEDQDLKSLIKRADQMLYKAKESGKNKVMID